MPPRLLALAVLRCALDDLADATYAESAGRWLFGACPPTEADQLFSFPATCELAGVSPHAIRRAAQARLYKAAFPEPTDAC